MSFSRFGKVALASVGLIIVGSSLSAASPSPSTFTVDDDAASPEELQVSQEDRDRDALLDPTWGIVSERPGFQDGGLAADRDALEFYWFGPVDDTAQQAIDDARHSGVPVIVHHLKYSQDQLWSYAIEIVKELERQGGESSGFAVSLLPAQVTINTGDEKGLEGFSDMVERAAHELLPPDVEVATEYAGPSIPFSVAVPNPS